MKNHGETPTPDGFLSKAVDIGYDSLYCKIL